MSDIEEEMCVLGVLCAVNSAAVYGMQQENSLTKRKREWVKTWKLRRSTKDKGANNLLHKELRLEDADSYRRYLRMNEDSFTELLKLVESDIQRQDTRMRPAISPMDSLTSVLRFLATGESYRSTEFHTRISLSYIAKRVPEICEIIYKNLRDQYMEFPVGEQWERIALNFESRWHFPNCLGCLDGKHVAFRAAKNDGALYYNYKGFNSVVLLAMCDAAYKFTYVDIGCNGRVSDGGVLNRSDLREVLDKGNQYFPNDRVIGNDRRLPYVILGDDAFPLERHLMKPFPYHTTDDSQRKFNFRLSHTRQTIEHTFGILSNRFRVLQTAIHLRPDKVVKIIQACCVLHNFLLTRSVNYAVNSANPQSSSVTVGNSESNRKENPKRHTNEAGKIRNSFADYFSNEGKIFY